MIFTAQKAQRAKLLRDVSNNAEIQAVLEQVSNQCLLKGEFMYQGALTAPTVSQLQKLGYKVRAEADDIYSIKWEFEDTSDSRFVQLLRNFDACEEGHAKIHKGVKFNTILCIIIIVLLLLMNAFGFVIYNTKQVGLVALIDTPSIAPNIPGLDPDAIIPPDDDKVQKLNEKLDKGKMCINMVSKVTFDDSYTAGYVNIVNDPANNYPQFVTITLDNNGMQIYQSGLIEIGKSIPYAMLEIELPAGDYDCTAVFSQVDTETNKYVDRLQQKLRLL